MLNRIARQIARHSDRRREAPSVFMLDLPPEIEEQTIDTGAFQWTRSNQDPFAS
jgi:hypothetical protein